MISASVGTHLRFESLGYAWLLLLIPLTIALAYRSLAGLGGFRWAAAVTLRCAVILLLTLALAGPSAVRTITDQVVIFALDLSESVTRTERDAAFAFLREAAGGARPGMDRVAVVSFGRDAQVEQLPQPQLQIDRTVGPNRATATDLAAALQLAQALFPPDAARRIVLLSDGNQNIGDALAPVEAAAGAGIPIDVRPLHLEVRADVLIESVAVPAGARLDETVVVNVVLRATAASSGRLLLYHNDQLIELDSAAGPGRLVQLAAGVNRETFPVTLRTTGAHRFRAVFEPAAATNDARRQNNEGRAFTLVAGPQRVLLLADLSRSAEHAERESAELVGNALRGQGVECDLADAASAPLSPESLSPYAAVILANVPATSLGPAGELALAASVRELGLGLVMIGGDQSFTVGGYHESPIGDILPVETSRQKLQLPSLGQVFVLDRSGSMMGPKLELAKRAAILTIDLLNPRDFIGVVGFDAGAEWVVPFARGAQKAEIKARIANIGAGGGTDMHPALDQAITALAKSEAALRHIVLLTDGQTAPADFDALTRRMTEAKITCSSIAIGKDVDRVLLTKIASTTGGRTYLVDGAQPLPQIFARETVLAGRAALYERTFTPRLIGFGADTILRGFSQGDIPSLNGHVVTAARPLASVALSRPTEDGTDPILAYWQVGLGKTVAFTSGMWPRWGPEWTAWPRFSTFWAQLARWVSRTPMSTAFEISSRSDGDRVSVVLDARDASISRGATLTWNGRVLDPEGTARELAVRQSGPGRYQADFTTSAPGTYFLNLRFDGSGVDGKTPESGVIQTGVVVPYSREYRDLQSNRPLLAEIARRTGGRTLNEHQAAAVFEPAAIRPVEAARPAWDSLVQWALLLFILDVAVRRLALNPLAAAARLRARIGEAAHRGDAVAAEATVSALRGVQTAMREDQPQQKPARTMTDSPRATETDRVIRPSASVPRAPRPAEAPPPDETNDAGADPLARLRAARRRARDAHERRPEETPDDPPRPRD